MISGLGDARIVDLSLRVYRALLVSYPRAFRQDYAGPMLQAYGDYTRRVYQQRGVPGLVWWWAITFFDYLNSVVEEHLQRMTAMTKEKFIRLGAWAFMFSAIILIAGFALGGLYETPFGRTAIYELLEGITWSVMALSVGTGMFALRALYKEKLSALGSMSLAGGGLVALVSFLGLVVNAVLTSNDLGWFFFIFGLLGMSVALLLFGVDTARRQILPRWNGLPFMTGVLLPLLWIGQLILEGLGVRQNQIDFFFPIAVLGMGIGMFMLGILLQGEGKLAEAAA